MEARLELGRLHLPGTRMQAGRPRSHQQGPKPGSVYSAPGELFRTGESAGSTRSCRVASVKARSKLASFSIGKSDPAGAMTRDFPGPARDCVQDSTMGVSCASFSAGMPSSIGKPETGVTNDDSAGLRFIPDRLVEGAKTILEAPRHRRVGHRARKIERAGWTTALSPGYPGCHALTAGAT